MAEGFEIRDAVESDLPGILAIYNDAVVNTTATWNYDVVDLANRARWLGERQSRGLPVFVAVAGTEVLAYASFGDFRPFDGYRFTVEHSIYVHPDHHRKGVGRAIMLPLIERAKQSGKRVMIGGIASENIVSIEFHGKFGFMQSGYLPKVGFKFGRWLDLVFMQLNLDA